VPGNWFRRCYVGGTALEVRIQDRPQVSGVAGEAGAAPWLVTLKPLFGTLKGLCAKCGCLVHIHSFEAAGALSRVVGSGRQKRDCAMSRFEQTAQMFTRYSSFCMVGLRV
jgi:hypothetical protein